MTTSELWQGMQRISLGARRTQISFSIALVSLLAAIASAFSPMRPAAIRLLRQQRTVLGSGTRPRRQLTPAAAAFSRRHYETHRCIHRQDSIAPLHSSSAIPDIMAVDDNNNETIQYTPYEQWVRRLYQTNLFHPVKLGLQNMQELHEHLGRPMDKLTVIHIAGTNGKGSVALKIAKTLELTGLRVGLFCSPHVSSFRERMQVNGNLISEEQVVEYLPRIYELCNQHDIPATFFEIATALAFMFYAEENVDVVVLETGLGGRLDATNVIRKPALSVITSIGLEHTRILGDTVELIALEKGGIIKEDCPVLVGPNVPHQVLRECAKEKKAKAYYTCDDVLGEPPTVITDYDEENARIATAAIHLLDQFDVPLDIVKKGTRERPPCRFETLKLDNDLTVILDVAHNPDAMEYLVRKLQATYPNDKFRVVVGMSSDKDLGKCGRSILQAVGDNVQAIHVVQAAHPRAASVEAIVTAEPRLNDCHFDTNDRSIAKQVCDAMRLATANGEILVVCGSVFLMSEAREALGIDEPRDSKYIAEVAGSGVRSGQENFGNTDPGPDWQQNKK